MSSRGVAGGLCLGGESPRLVRDGPHLPLGDHRPWSNLHLQPPEAFAHLKVLDIL